MFNVFFDACVQREEVIGSLCAPAESELIIGVQTVTVSELNKSLQHDSGKKFTEIAAYRYCSIIVWVVNITFFYPRTH